jgi:hypothetical protein
MAVDSITNGFNSFQLADGFTGISSAFGLGYSRVQSSGGRVTEVVEQDATTAGFIGKYWNPSPWVRDQSYVANAVVNYNGTNYYNNSGAATTNEPPAAPWAAVADPADLPPSLNRYFLQGDGVSSALELMNGAMTVKAATSLSSSSVTVVGTLQASGRVVLDSNPKTINVSGVTANSIVVACYSDANAHVVPLYAQAGANTITLGGDANSRIDWFVAKF